MLPPNLSSTALTAKFFDSIWCKRVLDDFTRDPSVSPYIKSFHLSGNVTWGSKPPTYVSTLGSIALAFGMDAILP